jgi:putative ABC transport system permease protein
VISLLRLAWRNLIQGRLRTLLSVITMALGTAMTLASDVTSRSLATTLGTSEDLRTLMGGLVDRFVVVPQLAALGVGLAAGFFILNAFMISLAQRRHEIGLLRLQGATRRQIALVIVVEVLLICLIGCVLGSFLGYWAGKWVILTISRQLGEGILVFTFTPTPFLAAAGLAALVGLVGLLAGLAPAYLAVRVPPLAAVRVQEDLGANPKSQRMTTWFALFLLAVIWIWVAVWPPGEWVQHPWDGRLTFLVIGAWLAGLLIVFPGLVDGGSQVLRNLKRLGPVGRLVTGNLRRSLRRVVMAALTLAMAVMMVIAVTGLIGFMFNSLMRTNIERAAASQAWVIAPFNFTQGMSGYSHLEDINMSPEFLQALRDTVGQRGRLLVWRFVLAPEISSMGESYFSFVLDPYESESVGQWVFVFQEGDWDSAGDYMRQTGCGLLMLPLVAQRNGVGVGDRLRVTGPEGPVECTVAGLGSGYVTATVILDDGTGPFASVEPISALVVPGSVGEQAELGLDLQALVDQQAMAQMTTLGEMADLQTGVVERVPLMFNALLLVAVGAAALGIVNNTVISVVERRGEIALLRAVGAIRSQVMGVILGEAAVVGLLGGLWGGIAGAGVVALMVLVHGGNSWGVPDLDLWAAAADALGPALMNGAWGIVLTPLVSVMVAWLAARGLIVGAQHAAPIREERSM